MGKNELNKIENIVNVTVNIDTVNETADNLAAISRLITAHNTDIVAYGANLDLDMRITNMINDLLKKEIKDLKKHIGINE